MKSILLILFIGLCHYTFGQTFSELERVMAKEFSKNSTEDGRWVFYADKANIEKIEKPILKEHYPSYNFFKITMTNYLGYHINQGNCIILFDSSNSKVTLVEPLWYNGVSESLIKLFINNQFDNQESLLATLKEIHELMVVGSGYKFIKTGVSDSIITYDLVYFKGDSYTTGGNGISTTVNYNKDGVWRQIEVEMQNLKIKKYIVINPAARKGDLDYKMEQIRIIE